ncbi:unnamed protein product [Vicia faba]|uniref:RBR-type E3 ubiquitin transferase n=1 Tax=Vicia faba TaxID=3906 RepID=A0AAV0YSM6_VICFA|nr:unnamed protein product [Vicia faba]
MNGRHHRHKSSATSKPQQYHRAKSNFRYVKKSELSSSSNSLADEERVSPEDVDVNGNSSNSNNTAGDVASSSTTKEGGDDHDIDLIIDNRLDKLLSDIQQPELSIEEITINDQLQQDELLVVESIYGENVFSLDTWKGLRCFQIHINIDTLDEIGITAKMNSVSEVETISSNSDDFLYSFKVQYLPPIVLTCLLPKSTARAGSDLPLDSRVVSGIGCIDADIPFLQSYNNERRHQNFLKELHECCICYSEYPGTEFVQLPCKHFFCRKCVQTFTQIHVKEGNISNLQCLDAKCKDMIPPSLLKRFLGDEDYKRWESVMLEKTLASMSDVVYCSRCETPCIEDEDQHAQCPKCFFSFCTLCRERRHVGIECMTLDMKLQLLQDRQNSSQLKGNQRRLELEKINEMLSEREIRRDSKFCPSCDMAISRTEGCNKMKCGNCEQYFCYRCNQALDASDPYGHFRDGSCELFPREMIDNWQVQARVNPLQEIQQVHAELFHLGGSACPSCRQFNVKIGNNNHMLCWACQSHYCYLCNGVVRRGTKHYGPKGCKQHSEG